ncbi:Ankyrin repeat and fibronectin type-III domain-containing protein 1-like [Homarus americanus]|uniref:Ankyrin repeat and fibronectin type-III domain-containing protein 1-like n=1 Tax=Homarus americanus TaxID=6706 RepID=A0A8J5N7V7_HOMAM|nr:Ankyrin repeat and fibronectin type-III domain-containing protein 1-like [Homarus americanus]
MQLQVAGTPPVRRRKKPFLNLAQPFNSLRRSIRASIHCDLVASPTSPVRMTRFIETGSPPIVEDTVAPAFPNLTAPITVPDQDSLSVESSQGCGNSPTSLESPPTVSVSSSTSLTSSGLLQQPCDDSSRRSSLKSVAFSSSSKEDMASRSRALSFTTLRRRRGPKNRQTRSTEVSRRSWEMEDWEKELLEVPNRLMSRRNTYANENISSNSLPVGTPPRTSYTQLPGDATPSRALTSHDALSTMDDVLVDGLNPSKADRKKLEKINIHLHALFAAVEHGQSEKAKNILDNNQLDINSVNKDGSNVLEVAVMNNHVALAKMLQQAGATESNAGTIEQRIHHLNELVSTAERRREELDSKLSGGAPHGRETERQRELWDRRVKMLRTMKMGLEQMIEWSMDEWVTIGGSLEIYDLRRMSVFVDGLSQGKRHHFRVCAGNLKDYGPPLTTTPTAAIPSSWRDSDAQKPRLDGQVGKLDDLFNQVCNSRPQHAAEIKAIEPGQETPLNLRKAQKKKSIKNLFTPAPKFHRNLKKGSYLACIVYCDDKVLVTTEEFPPVVEVDDDYMGQARSHFHWLLKVATTWEDVKSLRQDMDRAGSASNVPFRIKLLQAAANMQTTLGIQDLGQFYHKPIVGSNGTLVFCTMRHVKSTKVVSAMNVKWIPLSKLKERKSTASGQSSTQSDGGTSAGDILLSSLQDQILYDKVSRVPLRRGLYLGYLKLQSSVDVLQVLVPEKTPNMFPHVKIRDNPHVSREEWEWVQSLELASMEQWHLSAGAESVENEGERCSPLPSVPSAAQHVWHSQLCQATQQLLNQLEVEEEAQHQHRLYCREVLELSPDVALLLVMPPVDAVCSAPGQEDALFSQPNLATLPLQIFEMIHMGTYQRELIGRYARLSYILEMDTLMAQHANREAFSQDEINCSRDRLWQLQSFQEQLDATWRGLRWVMDAISYARDKAASGAPLTNLLSCSFPSTTPQPAVQQSTSHMPAATSPVQDTHSSSESLQLGADSKRLRKDDDLSFSVKKSETPRMLKSNTSENIRATVKCETRFHKSKTAECLVHSSGCVHSCIKSYNSLNDCLLDSGEQNENVPLLSWTHEKMEYSGERKMYSKDLPTSRSENHLQHCVDHGYPPRKASAPAFYDTHEGCLKSKCCTSEPKINQSISSLESVEQGKRKKNSCVDLEYEETMACSKSPTSSCFDLHQRYGSNLNVDMQRAGSSLSHDSEASFSSMTASLRSLSSNETETDTLSLMCSESGRSEAKSTEGEELVEGAARNEEFTIIRVYAAYQTGMASGTSVKIHITPRTTAREVIDLVVKQLNVAVVLKGKSGPTYGNDKLKDFCLVAVIGMRERCLREDFRPLQLQNPWKRGKLYVRLKQDVLAALEQSNSRHSAYL